LPHPSSSHVLVLMALLSFVAYSFFSSRRRHTRSKRDWSSDVCSSDLPHWYKMYKRLVGNYWQADEINMASDVKQFSTLTEEEQDAYLKIIGLLSTLDAPQTRTALLISLYATD